MADHEVFVSYARPDASIVERLRLRLQGMGIRCWVDTHDIPIGADWGEALADNLRASRAMVLIYSAHANTSKRVRDEVNFARSKDIPIIPFAISTEPPSSFLEMNVGRFQWLRADPADPTPSLEKLAQDLQELISKPPGAARPKPVPPKPKPRPKKLPLPPPADDSFDFANPYDIAVTATPVTFKGRSREIEKLLDHLQDGNHTAIFGLQRMGKTSLIVEGLKEGLAGRPALAQKILSVKIEVQGMGGEQIRYRDFLGKIIEAIIDGLSKLGIGKVVNDLREHTHRIFHRNECPEGDRAEFFAKVSRLLIGLADAAKRRIVVFIDEFSELRRVITNPKAQKKTVCELPQDMLIDVPFMHHLSSLLKDEQFKARYTFVVVVRPFMSEFDEKADLQVLKLMKGINIGYLDQHAAKALITEPVAGKLEYGEGAVDYLCRLTSGHPYLLQFILNTCVADARRERRRTITLDEIRTFEDAMVADPEYETQFNVVMSDYSVAEVTHPQEARIGKGTLALISRFGQEHPDGWVPRRRLVPELRSNKIPEDKIDSLLAQLKRTRIIEEGLDEGDVHYRITIPLLRKRLVKQNFYGRYFVKDQ
jgi:hypothetical protein